MKRIFALFLALVSVLALAACGAQNAGGTTQTSQSTSGTSAPVTNGEKIDFGGKKFTIAINYSSGYGYEVDGYYEKEEDIYTAIEERNKKIETLYNCKIEAEDIMSGVLENDLMTGKNTIDIVCSSETYKGPDKYLDLNAFGIDFTKDWWLSDFMNGCSFEGKNFYTLCYGSLSAFECTQVLIYNKAVKSANNALKDVDFYALVESGDWTLDKFHETVKHAAKDIDENGSIEDYNGEIYGLVYDTEYAGTSFYFGAGGKYASNDGEIRSAIDESSVILTDKIISLFGDGASAAAADTFLITNLTEGKAMFAVDELYRIRDYAKGFSNKPGAAIGILPIPNAESGAPDYISYPEANMYSMSVPKTCTDIAQIGKFLDLYAYHSKETVFPEYKKWIASYADGENTEKMLGYVFENLSADITANLNLNSAHKDFSKNIAMGENSFKDNFKKYQNMISGAAQTYKNKFPKS